MIKYMLLIFVMENGHPIVLPLEEALVYDSEIECMDDAVKLYFDRETVIQGACTPYVEKTGDSV